MSGIFAHCVSEVGSDLCRDAFGNLAVWFLAVGVFLLLCRVRTGNYQTGGAALWGLSWTVVEDRQRGYFARIQVAIIRGYLCFE